MSPTSRHFFQNAWVVENLDLTIGRLSQTFGIGPFFVVPEMPLKETSFRGQPSQLKIAVALAQAGPIQIELICPRDNTPSVFQDPFKNDEENLHHMAVFTKDYQSDIRYYKKSDFEVVSECVAGTGGQFAYIDTRGTLGVMLEIVEESERLTSLYGMIAHAAENWDGKNPYRLIELPS